MNIKGWLELALFIVVLILITKPLGVYLLKVLDVDGNTFLDPILRPLERITYRLFGIDPKKEQGWIGYTISILVFSTVGVLFTYLILRFQDSLPLNPQKFRV
jgi:K+-transporting ATPase ATPase A chain